MKLRNLAAAFHRNTDIFTFAMGACCVYYVWVVTSAHGDFQGDSWEYLDIAAQMRAGLFHLASYSYTRGLLYPWFLSVTWHHAGFLTYFIQVALLLTSLYFALRLLAFRSVYCLVPICAAMIPAVAFLQAQIYPDGILMSLMLLFFSALARRHWAACVLIGLLLALTKLVFIVVLPVALIAYLFETRHISFKILAWSITAGLVLSPVFVLLFDYTFVDLGYMVMFARPYSHGYPIERVFPNAELTVTCAGREHSIPRKDLFLAPITTPYSLAAYGPLTQAQAKELGCTDQDLRSMKRHLVAKAFAEDPILHVKLATVHVLRSMAGWYYVPHMSGIFHMREHAWLTHYNALSYFEPYEVTLQEGYRKNGFEVGEKKPPVIFMLNEVCEGVVEPVLRWAAVGLLGLCWVIAYRRGHFRDIVLEPVNVSMMSFVVLYSFLVSVSTPFVYDRYTFVNLLIVCILVARVAAMLFGAPGQVLLPARTKDRPETGG